jgi:hypothetical protein
MVPLCLIHSGIFVILLSFHKNALVVGNYDVAIVLFLGSVDIFHLLMTHCMAHAGMKPSKQLSLPFDAFVLWLQRSTM